MRIHQIVDGQYEVDTMSCAGPNKFFIPSIRYEGEKVWYYFDDIQGIIPEPHPQLDTSVCCLRSGQSTQTNM
ncbi:hypothetical protein G5714_004488 [Onychostoma macrolepis]|uniref:Uncharacterized protein n=1 Tax=Onychostoma macrolepis TaxID=369639 RepID=A0A7J6D5C2_9TELE|nr:hypothetical protein G5714_004488 [Onychostoma macrolepis]